MLPKLNEPIEEVKMRFAGRIPFMENKQNNYLLVSVEHLTFNIGHSKF